MSQIIIKGKDSYKQIEHILAKLKCKKYFLVCDSSFSFLNIKDYFLELGIPYIMFSDFTANPLYEDVCKGVTLFRQENCDMIIAVGGGSSLDVAKCIKLYAKMDSTKSYLEQPYSDSGIPLIAIPTTAGTGSESTRYAVIYSGGQKQSITHESIVPNYAILEHSVLKTLPLYQKKCTMLDALCQGIESWWSVNSTKESKEYSKIAVETIMKYKDAYLTQDSEEALEQMLLAANYAGRAINITQTTAAHAMSYKLTSMYRIPHGHAVALCLAPLWKFMQGHIELCVDVRGKEYLHQIFMDISRTLGYENSERAVVAWKTMLKDLQLQAPCSSEEEVEILAASVNTIRLSNNPIPLTNCDLKQLYSRIGSGLL